MGSDLDLAALQDPTLNMGRNHTHGRELLSGYIEMMAHSNVEQLGFFQLSLLEGSGLRLKSSVLRCTSDTVLSVLRNADQ